MFQNIVKLLSQMGLKETDAKIYLICLHHKEGMYTHEIVKDAKLKRSSIDLILKRLIADEYITKIKVENRYKYFAESPETIFLKKNEALDNFQSIMPILNKLGSNKGKTEIVFFEGKEGIKKIYEDVYMKLKFAEGEEKQLLSFSSGADIMKIFPDMQKSFIDKRVKLSVPYKAISPKNSKEIRTWTNDPESLREVRYIDEELFPFKITFEIYADSILIFSPNNPIGGMIIRNPNISSSMRALFNFVWQITSDKMMYSETTSL